MSSAPRREWSSLRFLGVFLAAILTVAVIVTCTVLYVTRAPRPLSAVPSISEVLVAPDGSALVGTLREGLFFLPPTDWDSVDKINELRVKPMPGAMDWERGYHNFTGAWLPDSSALLVARQMLHGDRMVHLLVPPGGERRSGIVRIDEGSIGLDALSAPQIVAVDPELPDTWRIVGHRGDVVRVSLPEEKSTKTNVELLRRGEPLSHGSEVTPLFFWDDSLFTYTTGDDDLDPAEGGGPYIARWRAPGDEVELRPDWLGDWLLFRYPSARRAGDDWSVIGLTSRDGRGGNRLVAVDRNMNIVELIGRRPGYLPLIQVIRDGRAFMFDDERVISWDPDSGLQFVGELRHRFGPEIVWEGKRRLLLFVFGRGFDTIERSDVYGVPGD